MSLALGVLPARAQVSPSFYDYARPGLDWYTIETEHFNVLFHVDPSGAGSSRTARVVARIAEDIYEPITSLYGHRPDTKVSIILKDFEDYSNGAAYFFDNKIEIWAPALETPLRGGHNWLRNVITHEFTHIVQVQKAMKADRRLPFFYFQLLDYEDVKRPDVLYGYPDIIVTYPIPVLNNPAWFAEGTAQYQRAGLRYDGWDTHRDMLLRTRVLAGEELSLAEMGGFYSHTSLLREAVYNHGFAFTHYLASTYGEESLRRISERLGRWQHVNVERAMQAALGRKGQDVYDAWMAVLRQEYEARTAHLRPHLVEGQVVEADGFYNFYPRFSPDGRRLAYISNRGEDFSRTSLYVRDLDSGRLLSHDLEGWEPALRTHTCAFGHEIQAGVSGAFAWHPDGNRIVYARNRDTRGGATYSDLYVLDLETRKGTRLTYEQRATAPAFAPGGDRLAFVGQADGTSNLYLLDLETRSAALVTAFDGGQQVSDPAWHPAGTWIYFALQERDGRDLYRIRPDGSGLEAVLATDADERSPAVDPEGTYLYFSSDRTGIFNLYRLPASGAGAPEQLTNVLGGAFMPAVRGDGAVAFARYEWDGYKIAWLEAAAPVPAPARGRYEPPPILQKEQAPALAASGHSPLNAFDDTDLRPLGTEAVTAVRTEGRYPLGRTRGGEAAAGPELGVEPYGSLFTSFSFFPVLRLDQYVSRERGRLDARLPLRSPAETLLRNTKVGLYAASREILEGLSLLGGLLVGPASTDPSSVQGFFAPSNLLDLERDAFLQFEYRKGLGLIPYRWSPQLSVELYNIVRNVENGLSLEESCEKCYPDTTWADLSYRLWEADVAARSKVSRSLLLEAGYRYSPYRVVTQSFYSVEAGATVPASSARYFIGRAFRLKAYLEQDRAHRHADVVPEGLRLTLGYEYEPGRLLRDFELEDGLLVPAYEQYRNHRFLLEARLGRRLPGTVGGGAHGVGLRLRASTILGSAVDPFFNDYVGGLTGARGYPFYALGGNETLWLQASYYVPLLPSIRRHVLFLYMDKLYARLYADAAAAWSGPWPGLEGVRKDVGAELRLALGSFYLLPTAVFLSATYGLDAFDFRLDDRFVAPGRPGTVRYGRELLWHFGVLFAFDL